MRDLLVAGLRPSSFAEAMAGRNAPRYVWAVLALTACWPTVRWYGARMVDGADEPWGVLALAVAILFAGLAWRQGLAERRVVCASLVLLVPALAGGVMTPLIQGVFVALALALLLADRRCWVGHAGLFVLALPLISSLQFYGGYPLRWLIGKLSVGILNVFGLGVEVEGTVMRWRGEMIVIDAPCSGVQMLWSAAFLACVMICIQKLGVRRSVFLLQVASASAFAGNVLRNCLLFFVESGLVKVDDWGHDAVGLAVFAVVLGVIVWLGSRLAVGDAAMGVEVVERRSVYADLAFLGVLAVGGFGGAGVAERMPEGAVSRGDAVDTVRDRLFGEGWYSLELDSRTAEYAKGFPGAIEIYGKGDRRLVVRVIERATRRYHLSADCYRAIGYSTEPLPLLQAIDGTQWGRVLAERDGERVEVRERVTSQDGQSWTDPSSWFWSAMLGESEGPWVGYAESVPLEITEF